MTDDLALEFAALVAEARRLEPRVVHVGVRDQEPDRPLPHVVALSDSGVGVDVEAASRPRRPASLRWIVEAARGPRSRARRVQFECLPQQRKSSKRGSQLRSNVRSLERDERQLRSGPAIQIKED